MTEARKRILAICGSTRSGSTNELLLEYLKQKYFNVLDIQIHNRITDLPHFNPDLDNDANLLESVSQFRNQIAASDGVLICTPEYVFSLPGTFKNSLDWLVSTTVLSNKPTAFITASASGEKAHESLDLILTTLGAKFGENSKLLIQGIRSKTNSEGLISDDGTTKDINNLINSLQESLGLTPETVF